jgi:GNAT superfamily N-acetyltransferase
MNFEIQSATAEQIIQLRLKILRPPGSLPEKARYPKDNEQTTYHFAAISSEQKIIGALTLEQDQHPELKSNFHYRLRGMAVDSKVQRSGVGRALVQHAETFLLDKIKCDLLWFSAREVAFPFYQSLGYEFHGSMFDIPDIGPHKFMYKALSKS